MSKKTPSNDVAYWMSKSPSERFSATEFLKNQQYGTPPRLQRVFRIVQREVGREDCIANKKDSGRAKDLADIEALGERIPPNKSAHTTA